MRSGRPSAAEALQDLGFTGLEALVYVSLLQAPGSTGYALARAVSKPVANTYKALQSLEGRGAVTSEDGSPRSFRALPFTELLNVLSRDFASRTAHAGKALLQVEGFRADDRVYRLTGREPILERARALIGSAQKVLLVDAFPAALDAVTDDLRSAMKRGVAVHAKTYAPTGLRGAHVAMALDGEAVMQRWDGTWLNVIADGQESLIGLLRTEESYGMWTRSAYAAWVYYSALFAEIRIARLENLAAEEPDLSIADALSRCIALPMVPPKLKGRKT